MKEILTIHAMVTDEVGYVSAKEHHIVPESESEQELQDEIQNGG